MTLNRAEFIPDRVWPFDPERESYGSAVDRAADPARWADLANGDVPLVTQWDDGEHDGPEPGTVATSSASMPRVVDAMLRALDPHPGVGGSYLDIGTGTGYTAARIAEIVGPSGFVTTIEVDETLATVARGNLSRAGIRNVDVITGDGFKGWQPAGPYSGVHVTCGIREISHAWIRQCLSGASIVMPWGTDYTPHDWLLKLTVSAHGTATGRLGQGLSFMKMRAQRRTFPEHGEYAPDGWMNTARHSESKLGVADVLDVIGGDGALAVSLRVPGCTQNATITDDGASVWVYSLRDKSVAAAGFADGMTPQVVQSGPRSLWDEIESAHRWWSAKSKPEPERFGLTVTTTKVTAWLDTPNGESWAL
ncbi:methyltransferase domain-containing protein [Yinghuangia sp. YIM S09857]|uniref:methyltransferase domain-containing protein n=1 Tax=Yinghuangia sp. YIM S09857 TaxID=3436929 RepID=UPI003F53815A